MASEYPVELLPPDITPYRAGNTGVAYVTTFESGRDGPHVMLMAITHGNELCGAITLDFLFRQAIRPKRGRLTLGFSNWMAYERFDPAEPTASRFVDEDINRVWDKLDGPRDSVELRRARELAPIVATADYLLDIHSMQHPTVPLMLAGPLAKGRELALRVGYPEHVMCDRGHDAGLRMRDWGGFGDPASPRNALLVECGQHWEKASAEVALQTALRFLLAVDAVEEAAVAPHLGPRPPRQKVIEVTQAITVRSAHFTFAEPWVGMEVIGRKGTVIGHDGGRPVTTPYDDCVLVMPSRRLVPGNTAVRLGRFVAG